jgi:prophage regulatory protein
MITEAQKHSRGETRERFLSLKEVEYVTSLKKSTIYMLIKRGKFPGQNPVTERRRAWLASEVEAWIGSRCGGSKVVSDHG